MPCRDCGREFAYARSEYCIGCAGVRTLGVEIRQEWPSDQLRRVAADLIVSCARSVRALRLHRCPQVSQRPAEQQAPQVGGRSPLRRARGWTRFESPGGGAPRSRSRGGREVQTERRSRRSPEQDRPEVEPDYSYYDSYSDEERYRQERNTEEKGASAKSRARPRSTSAERRIKEKATPAVKEEVQEKQSERPRSEKRVRGVIESKVEAGTEEDKKRSKEQYLRSLEERQQAEKHPIRLEERDRSSKAPAISSGQLKLADDYGGKDRRRRRRRPQQ